MSFANDSLITDGGNRFHTINLPTCFSYLSLVKLQQESGMTSECDKIALKVSNHTSGLSLIQPAFAHEPLPLRTRCLK